MTHLRSLLAACGVLLAAAGCSSEVDYGPTGTIAGRLTKSGTPLQARTHVIFMHPEKGYLAFGATDEEGRFTVTSWNDGQMPTGRYGVMIQPPAAEYDSETASAEDVMNNPEKYSVPPPQADFPARYRELSTSGLSYEVKQGANSFDIDLTH